MATMAGVELPDLDTLWSVYRHWSDRRIAAELEVDHSGLSRWLRSIGWERAAGSRRLRAVPCRVCTGTVRVRESTVYRLCTSCLADPEVERGPEAAPKVQEAADTESEKRASPNVRRYREELAKRRDRIGTPEWNAEYRRIGGPAWSGRRGAAA